MKKIKYKWMAKSFFKRLLHPSHIAEYVRISKKKGKFSRSALDQHLMLYSRILPGGFLHYGYFNDPKIEPENLGLADLQKAQLQYSELILKEVRDRNSKVLDVGCGTGGLIHLLLQNGFMAAGLTPDHFQVQYIIKKYPAAEVIHAKFQNIEIRRYENVFGTIINSESLQYFSLSKAFEVVEKILKPGGRWIIVDYFRIENSDKSGHYWAEFEERIKESGYQKVVEINITANIFPTLAFIHMWGEKIGLPLFEFIVDRFRRKHPRIHYFFHEILTKFNFYFRQKLETVNPEKFVKNKKYMFVVLEKPS